MFIKKIINFSSLLRIAETNIKLCFIEKSQHLNINRDPTPILALAIFVIST